MRGANFVFRSRTVVFTRHIDARAVTSAAAITDSVYKELCGLSYHQNELYKGLCTEPLPKLHLDAVPIVHHPLYSAPTLPTGHRFPMKIFQRIHDRLFQDSVARKNQVCYAWPLESPTVLTGPPLPHARRRSRLGLQTA
jgi:hypothetical protein